MSKPIWFSFILKVQKRFIRFIRGWVPPPPYGKSLNRKKRK